MIWFAVLGLVQVFAENLIQWFDLGFCVFLCGYGTWWIRSLVGHIIEVSSAWLETKE